MLKTVLLALLLLSYASSATAMSPVIFPPGQQLAESSEIVIAIPRAISCRKQEKSQSSGLLTARVTVIWEVLVSWKGKLHVGDRFTSREMVYSDESGPCFYRYDKAMLLYLRGDQPYRDVFWYPLERATEQLQELDEYKRRGGH